MIEFLNSRQMAARFGTTIEQINEWVKRGALTFPAYQHGSRRWSIYQAQELDDWLARRGPVKQLPDTIRAIKTSESL
jgi:hypothetical protein